MLGSLCFGTGVLAGLAALNASAPDLLRHTNAPRPPTVSDGMLINDELSRFQILSSPSSPDLDSLSQIPLATQNPHA